MAICDHFDWTDLYFSGTLQNGKGLSKVFQGLFDGTDLVLIALGAHSDGTFSSHSGTPLEYDFNHSAGSVLEPHETVRSPPPFAYQAGQKLKIHLRHKSGGQPLVVNIWLDQANGWKIEKA